MSVTTEIAWTDSTWNPVRGCDPVSPGCKNCYAKRFAERWRGIPGHPFEQGFDVRLVPEALDLPLRWRKPRRVFVNSMSDLFHEDVPFSFARDVLARMMATPRHTYQLLTKRPERMREFFTDYVEGWPILHNLWLGVSIENQAAADERIPHLMATSAAVRFLSCEPLLGPVTLPLCREEGPDWVIVGGESGPGARPCAVSWIQSLVAQCREAGVPAFVKQLGAWPAMADADWRALATRGPAPLITPRGGNREGFLHIAYRHPKGADMAEWPEDLRVREFPETA